MSSPNKTNNAAIILDIHESHINTHTNANKAFAKVFTPKSISTEFSSSGTNPHDRSVTFCAYISHCIAGACRTDELCNMKVAHVDLRKDIIVINIPHTKNKSCRKFVIVEPMWIDVVTRYLLIRPSPDIPRLFIGFRSGKPTRQNMGHNTISTSAIKIVTYLKLPGANNYTGHSFRRTSATILADNGGDILSLKRHGRWKSSTVAEVYVGDSITDKKRIVSMVQGTTVNYEPDLPPSTSIFEVTPSTSTSVSKSNTELNIPVENFTSNTEVVLDNSIEYLQPSVEMINAVQSTEEGNSSRDSDKQINAIVQGTEEGSNLRGSDKSYQWDRQAILLLISLYKDHHKDFKNTSIKNEKVWGSIKEKFDAEGFKYSKTQIENKFKYLKARYIKKKDNEGSKRTGASPISFEYFDDFDEIFGKNPNVTPTSSASSLRGSSPALSTDSENEPPKKKTRLEKQITNLTDIFEKQNKAKEDARERRFESRQATLERAISVYQETMNTFMQKLFEKKE
ncbi:phage integrase-related [Holotrichia oblita]|uniref:Phage integrase-related n=1 Tax=Holotrichia oblita TaxID=644536 RepID=A0ACB9T2T3_HOLOL|nr:phage integrase-related [Holotrichia oblita]